MSSDWNGRTIDMALDWCCMRKVGNEVEEVCLRCGFSCKGHVEDVIYQRGIHICNPVARQPIPEWALVGRKADRTKS